MKQLIKILSGGLGLFIVLAILQEGEYFFSAWSGLLAERTPEASDNIAEPAGEDGSKLSVEDRRAVLATLRSTLQLMRHMYQSGGDERFAERMPASSGFIAELMADIEYLGRNHRLQDPELLQLELVELRVLDSERVEVRTRETWQVRVLWAVSREESEPPRVHKTRTKYLLRRGSRGWSVEGWAIDREEKGANSATS